MIGNYVARGNAAALAISNRQNDTLAPMTWAIISDVVDPGNATAADRSAIRVNRGTAIKANTLTDAPSSSNTSWNWQIGAIGANTLPSTADIAEVLIYSAKHDDATRQAVEGYLAAKYKL